MAQEEIKKIVIEEIRKLYRKSERIDERESDLYLESERTEELEDILFDKIAPLGKDIYDAGYEDDDFPVILFKWIYDLLFDEIYSNWNEELKGQLLEEMVK